MSKIYGFGDCGCKYETMSKDEIIVALKGVRNVVKKTGTVTSSAGSMVIQLNVPEITESKAFVEVLAANTTSRDYLRAKADTLYPFLLENYVVIPVSNAKIGDKVDFVIKLTYLTDDDESIVYLYV